MVRSRKGVPVHRKAHGDAALEEPPAARLRLAPDHHRVRVNGHLLREEQDELLTRRATVVKFRLRDALEDDGREHYGSPWCRIERACRRR